MPEPIKEEVRRAAGYLQRGLVILYPTDTVWGIGCDATDPDAVSRIYRIKQRSDRKSMLVLMDDPAMLSSFIQVIPPATGTLIDKADKPTTIIFPGAKNLACNLVAEDGSIGIRITSDPFCRQLIKRIGKPVVSTSANLSGEKAPLSFREIDPEILAKVDYAVNWRREELKEGIPSTIVRLDLNGNITLIRP
jgi:L-threonylcarbamoyladenylate synthase